MRLCEDFMIDHISVTRVMNIMGIQPLTVALRA
jgi:hypothetical protein